MHGGVLAVLQVQLWRPLKLQGFGGIQQQPMQLRRLGIKQQA